MFTAIHDAYGNGIHDAYGNGMVSAAAVTGTGISLTTHFADVAIVSIVAAAAATLCLPRHARVVVRTRERARRHHQRLTVWREPRTLMIALIGHPLNLRGCCGPV